MSSQRHRFPECNPTRISDVYQFIPPFEFLGPVDNEFGKVRVVKHVTEQDNFTVWVFVSADVIICGDFNVNVIQCGILLDSTAGNYKEMYLA